MSATNFVLDALDKKILNLLMQNSRMSYTQLAKRTRSSREVAAYRIKKLQDEGIILEFITEINTEKLGFKLASVFLSIRTAKETEFKKYLKTCTFAAWTSEFSGIWNFGVGIYGRSIEEIQERFMQIQEQFGTHIAEYRMTLHRTTAQYYEKYLNITPADKASQNIKNTTPRIDVKDRIILKELARNARIDCVALAKKTDLSAVAVAQRIRRLEYSRVIIRYSVFIDPARLGLYQFSVFLRNHHATDRKRLVPYLAMHPQISFVIEYVGDPFIECGIIVSDPFDARRIIQEIAGAFPNNQVVEFFLIQNEIISIGLPACVFE